MTERDNQQPGDSYRNTYSDPQELLLDHLATAMSHDKESRECFQSRGILSTQESAGLLDKITSEIQDYGLPEKPDDLIGFAARMYLQGRTDEYKFKGSEKSE